MIDGVRINNYQQLMAGLAEHPDKPLQLTVECTVSTESRKRDAVETSKLVNISVPTQPMLSLGLVMTMGEITAIQDGSPADGKLKAHDRILKIDGKPIDDPMRLPDQLRRRAGETITLTVEHATARRSKYRPRSAMWIGMSSLKLKIIRFLYRNWELRIRCSIE